jgi:N-acetylglucosamine-6-phosphate deacetylase
MPHEATRRQRDGCILTPEGWLRGTIDFASRVLRVQGARVDAPARGDDIVLPGFIDLHVHGGGGADVMDGAQAIEKIAALHARHGTTALLATTVTASRSDLERALLAVGRAMEQPAAGIARVLGVHLEGPYINGARLGAQPDAARAADIDELRALHALAPIRVVTLAPELVGHVDFVRALSALGIAAQCGHTAGSYEAAVTALMAGVKGFTHLFNAMTPMHHREPGMVGAALAHATYAEIIPDLLHVHPGAIRAAMRAIPRLYCVTDSTAAAGMPDGEYRLGTHSVTKCMGGVRLADGTLAGSTLTMDQALRNLVDIGLELDDASRRLSTFPADYIGESDRGRLAGGAWADIVVFDPSLQLKAVYAEGVLVEHTDA